MEPVVTPEVVCKLEDACKRAFKLRDINEIIGAKEEVFAQFKPILNREHIPYITAEEFKSFLRFKGGNQHWTGLNRNGNRICSDMDRLRESLLLLLDESRAISDRFNKAVNMVPFMGPATASAILLIHNPDIYGVWNKTSEEALKEIGILPEFDRGMDRGMRYSKINRVLRLLKNSLEVDFWTLDAVWCAIIDCAPISPTRR